MAKKKKVDYEQLGKMMQNIYESGYIDRNQFYKMSFIKGVVTGLGGVVGATIVVAIVLWILSVINYVPLVGPIIEPIRDTLKTQKN
jgi:tetrahydromethanopterin S-methyltransferase subunit D